MLYTEEAKEALFASGQQIESTLAGEITITNDAMENSLVDLVLNVVSFEEVSGCSCCERGHNDQLEGRLTVALGPAVLLPNSAQTHARGD